MLMSAGNTFAICKNKEFVCFLTISELCDNKQFARRTKNSDSEHDKFQKCLNLHAQCFTPALTMAQ